MVTSVSDGIGWGWMLAYGIISLLVGMLAIAMPVPATFAATIVTGAYILAAGLASLLAGIFGKGYEGRFYAIAIGLISLIGGGIMMFQPTIGAASLTLLIASFLIVRGVMELAWGFRFRRRRWLMIGLGVLNLLFAGYLMYIFPAAALLLPGTVLGVSFLFSGMAWVMFAFDYRGATRASAGEAS